MTLSGFHGAQRDKVHLWFHHGTELISYHKFGELFSAKKFLDQVLENYDTSWVDKRTLDVHKGWITITSDKLSKTTLEQVMEHEYSPEEKKWRLPSPYENYADAIRRYHLGSHPDVSTISRRERGLPPITDKEFLAKGGSREVIDTKSKKFAEDTAERNHRPRKERVEKSGRSGDRRPRRAKTPGLVSVQEIAASIKLDAKEARGILRAKKVEKPEHGWAFTKEEVERIKTILEKGRKK